MKISEEFLVPFSILGDVVAGKQSVPPRVAVTSRQHRRESQGICHQRHLTATKCIPRLVSRARDFRLSRLRLLPRTEHTIARFGEKPAENSPGKRLTVRLPYADVSIRDALDRKQPIGTAGKREG